MKKYSLYFKENGDFNSINTFINNNDFIAPIFVIILLILTGLIELI